MSLTAAQSDALGRPAPYRAWQVELLATSGTVRFWSGHDNFIDPNSVKWVGLGHFGSISAVEQATQASAPKVEMVVSGLPSAYAALVLNAQADVVGHRASLGIGIWRPPIHVMRVVPDMREDYVGRLVVMTGTMGVPIFEMKTEAESITTTIRIPLEDILGVERNRNPAPLYSHFDQQRRFPGMNDRGLENLVTTAAAEVNVNWPLFP